MFDCKSIASNSVFRFFLPQAFDIIVFRYLANIKDLLVLRMTEKIAHGP